MAEATYYPTIGATMSETVPDTNMDGGREEATHYCGMESKLLGNSIMLRIDFSALTETPTAAELRLYVSSTVYGGNYVPSDLTFGFYRCRRDGSESAAWVTDEVTYNSYKTGSSWTQAGCENPTTDRETVDGTTAYGRDTAGWWNTDVTTMVQDMYTNHGKIFDIVVDGNFPDLPGEEDQAYMKIASRDSADYKPRLVITYSAGVAFVPQVMIF